MSQRKRRLLNLKERCDFTAELNVVKSCPERKKRPANGLGSDKIAKQLKPNKQESEKKQQWVLSSFGNFDVSSSQSVARNKNPNPQRPLLKNKSSQPRIQIDSNLWCEKYSPSSEADLAVHKKKVAEVRDWLLSHLCLQKGNGVLLLTGPPGSGKTATLRVLAKEIGLGIQEWVNPLVQNKEGSITDNIQYICCMDTIFVLFLWIAKSIISFTVKNDLLQYMHRG